MDAKELDAWKIHLYRWLRPMINKKEKQKRRRKKTDSYRLNVDKNRRLENRTELK